MGIHTSRSAEPLHRAESGTAVGTWGIWLTVVVLAMFTAGMAAASLYLHTGQPHWPPPDIQAPGRHRALFACGLALGAASSLSVALHRIRQADYRSTALLAGACIALLSGSATALVNDLRRAGFHWSEHAYTSVYWTLTGTAIAIVGTGALMIGAVLVQMAVGLVDEQRHLELTNTAIYAWFTALATTGLVALVHLLPAATGGVG